MSLERVSVPRPLPPAARHVAAMTSIWTLEFPAGRGRVLGIGMSPCHALTGYRGGFKLATTEAKQNLHNKSAGRLSVRNPAMSVRHWRSCHWRVVQRDHEHWAEQHSIPTWWHWTFFFILVGEICMRRIICTVTNIVWSQNYKQKIILRRVFLESKCTGFWAYLHIFKYFSLCG